jgi:hypothetical protein
MLSMSAVFRTMDQSEYTSCLHLRECGHDSFGVLVNLTNNVYIKKYSKKLQIVVLSNSIIFVVYKLLYIA